MRIDQILQSEHFGLHSTIDPHLESIYTEYYQLMSKKKLNEEESKKILELRSIINKQSVLGESRRERIALQYADEYIATTSSNSTDAEIIQARRTVRKNILKILRGK